VQGVREAGGERRDAQRLRRGGTPRGWEWRDGVQGRQRARGRGTHLLQALHEGLHLRGAERAVEADGDGLRVRDGVVERLDRLSGERAAREVHDRAADEEGLAHDGGACRQTGVGVAGSGGCGCGCGKRARHRVWNMG